MKANDARNRTQSAITKKKEAEAAAEQARLKALADVRERAKHDFPKYFEDVLKKIVETADDGKNATTWTFTAHLDRDGSHGPRHAYETELAKLTSRKLKADGYVVQQFTKADTVLDHNEMSEQVVVITLEISW